MILWGLTGSGVVLWVWSKNLGQDLSQVVRNQVGFGDKPQGTISRPASVWVSSTAVLVVQIQVFNQEGCICTENDNMGLQTIETNASASKLSNLATPNNQGYMGIFCMSLTGVYLLPHHYSAKNIVCKTNYAHSFSKHCYTTQSDLSVEREKGGRGSGRGSRPDRFDFCLIIFKKVTNGFFKGRLGRACRQCVVLLHPSCFNSNMCNLQVQGLCG